MRQRDLWVSWLVSVRIKTSGWWEVERCSTSIMEVCRPRVLRVMKCSGWDVWCGRMGEGREGVVAEGGG